MNEDRGVWREPEPGDWDAAERDLAQPNRYRWVAWVLVGALVVAPLYTLISVVQIAPVLVLAVVGFSVAAVYFVRASRADRARDN